MTAWQAWTILIVAGIFEVIWAYFLKRSEGLSHLSSSIYFVVTLAISMILLALSLRTIPLSLAYPIWTGIGAVGAVIAGVVFFQEPLSLMRGIFVVMIIGGVVGLKAVT